MAILGAQGECTFGDVMVFYARWLSFYAEKCLSVPSWMAILMRFFVIVSVFDRACSFGDVMVF